MLRKYPRLLQALLFLSVGIPHLAAGQERDASAEATMSAIKALQEDVRGMKSDLADVREQLAVIKDLLSQRAARPTLPNPSSALVGISNNPVLGDENAPVTVIEFSDYQCPFCARFVENTFPTLKAEYIDTGKLRYVFRDFPLERIHPEARKAAEAATCAGEQGKYWEMHDILFENQQALEVNHLKRYAEVLGIERVAFETCLDENRFSAEIDRDLREGQAAGVTGTPAFLVGKTTSDGTIQGTFIKGAQPLEVFKELLDRVLAEAETD